MLRAGIVALLKRWTNKVSSSHVGSEVVEERMDEKSAGNRNALVVRHRLAIVCIGDADAVGRCRCLAVRPCAVRCSGKQWK
ncbi:hypothetical protein KC363_g28 [Hortaea werneckii]|nr:hypothetical protein KC363_g28 [Hortaea werneckii]